MPVVFEEVTAEVEARPDMDELDERPREASGDEAKPSAAAFLVLQRDSERRRLRTFAD